MTSRSSTATLKGGKTQTKVRKKTTKPAARKTAAKKPRATKAKITKAPAGLIKRNPLGHLLMEKLLREVGFKGEVSTDKTLLEKYSTDESIFSIKPQVVLQPKTKRDVEITVGVLAKETERFPNLSLTPRAAGTGLGGGSLTDSIVIDVSKYLTDIGTVSKRKGVHTFTVEPGAMWRDVEKMLKKHGLYLPPYPASKDICSVGGSVANNAAGPDSLRYGHCADWVESMDVVLADGKTYTIAPLTYKEFKALVKQKHLHAEVAQQIFTLIEKNEKEIKKNEPKTAKNSAGYPLWDVMPEGVAKFKKGKGVFDLTKLVAGSQGTVGIMTSITMRALPIATDTTLIAIPIFDLTEAAATITKVLKYDPLNVEVFDSLTFDLALENPAFFRDRIPGVLNYYKVMFAMYSAYHVRFKRKIPEFIVLVTLDKETTDRHAPADVVRAISSKSVTARVVRSEPEAEMYWQIRRASYTLSKFQDPNKRPAAFLEDMTVPPENLGKFFVQIKKLLKEFNITAAIHGHGGNGHFHFYPLLDFTKKTTPALVEKMAEKFFATAIKYDGNICGEHNDGIIRTPHLSKMFSKKMLGCFSQTEHIFDPSDIFNPGKKTNPRFDIKETMRKTN